MEAPLTLTVAAGDLVSALNFRPRRKALDSGIVELRFDEATGVLTVEEARFGLFSNELPARGRWPQGIQIDGKILRNVALAHAAPTLIEILAFSDAIEVRKDRYTARLARLEATSRGVKHEPFPIDKRHKGRPSAKPDVRHPVPKGHTWLFSANVVFPPEEEQ